jgi:quinol monooxygenase YgiN
MTNGLKRNTVTRRLFPAGVMLILAATWFAGPARSQEAPKSGKIYAVIHVDSVPTDAANATKLLQQYAVDTRKDKGAVRIEVYVQADRPNHFSIVEVWQDQAAFDAHEAAAHTKKFREQIQPSLGSPFDERLHRMLE